MVASTRHQDHPEHTTPIPGSEHRLLPVAALYGANGAGKSNLVKAMEFLKDLVVKGREPGEDMRRQPFLLDKETAAKPTEFSVQFVENGKIYVFGCTLSDHRVVKEWLSWLDGGQENSVYQRVTSETNEVKIEIGPGLGNRTMAFRIDNDAKRTASSKVESQAQAGAHPNQLFLNTVSKSLIEEDQGEEMAAALGWFRHRLVIIKPNTVGGHLAKAVLEKGNSVEFATNFLKYSGTGVEGLKLASESYSNPAFSSSTRLGITAKLLGLQSLDNGQSYLSQDGFSIMERVSEDKAIFHTLAAAHRVNDGSTTYLPFEQESDGTQRLANLLPALHDICFNGTTIVLDEIDRSLHPLLAKGFVRKFLHERSATGGQLIFTTHETAFLDLDLLRRDEIWFANKPMPAGATELYSLSDYKVRTDLKVDKAYLQGRFEAVPPVELEMPEWVRDIESELHPQAGAAAANQA